jgi:hypothetical protein
MPSKQVYNSLAAKGVDVSNNGFTKYDCLESNDDMERLFSVLSSYKDCNGNHPVITANTIVANPNFEAMKADNFENYSYEPFTQTLAKYPNHHKVMDLFKTGIEQKLFRPEFHGREHVNIKQWMTLLATKDSDILNAALSQTFAIELTKNCGKRKNLMAAFDFEDEAEEEEIKKIIDSGIDLFFDIFQYYPESFIAPCYIWSTDIEERLASKGIKSIQGIPYQHHPNPGKSKYELKYHYTGQKNMYNQRYLVRNAFF